MRLIVLREMNLEWSVKMLTKIITNVLGFLFVAAWLVAAAYFIVEFLLLGT